MVEFRKNRWLYVFALIAGFSPPQHLLLVFAFPAYALFIVLVQPRLFLQPKKILTLIGCLALGLGVYLYYPLRSPSPPFGPTDITSLESFIHFVSAEGLRVNLFYYGLSDQPTRFGVFFECWSCNIRSSAFCWRFRARSGWRAKHGNRLSCAQCSSCRCTCSSLTPCRM